MGLGGEVMETFRSGTAEIREREKQRRIDRLVTLAGHALGALIPADESNMSWRIDEVVKISTAVAVAQLRAIESLEGGGK